LLELVPKYFEPAAVVAVMGGREETAEVLKLPFDFIFFTGSTTWGELLHAQLLKISPRRCSNWRTESGLGR
jgi:aldehyde dehydrogenase (NAD+)